MTATKCQKKVRIFIYKEAIVNPKKDNFFRLLKSHFLTKYVEIDMEFSMFNHDHTGVKFSRQMTKKMKKNHPTSNICPSFLTMFKIFEKL